jgi:hypothetical protein
LLDLPSGSAMPENLKEWLLPYSDRSGKLWPLSHMEFYRDLETARAKAGITCHSTKTRPLQRFRWAIQAEP